MPRRDECRNHYERSKLDRALADRYQTTLGKDFPDWEIVIRFYSALHLLQAYLITKNVRFHASKHSERGKALMASPELRNMRTAYRMLQDVSEQVRYDAGFTARPEDVETARENLEQVSRILVPKLKARLPLDPTTH